MVGAGKALKARPDSLRGPSIAHTGQDPLYRNLGDVPLSTELVVNGLTRPVQVVAPPNDYDRIFIVEQRSGSTGRIKIFNLDTGTLNSTPFLSVSVNTSSEQGLLGLAFHPNYAQNGYFYVNYTASGGTYIKRYTVSSNPDIADSGSAYTIMSFSQPYSNHNGGWLGFGPDGYLYIATGDGGSGGDPGNRAQDITNQRLGKLLRIDVDGGSPYAVPPDNPFVGVTGDDEIWAYGLRNPWRCNFDRETGDLWIGDVGQNAYEEVTFQPASSNGGENYGWRCYEGNHSYNTSGCPSSGTMVFPIWEYSHSSGCSITGGAIYRGSAIPSLQGTYFFADYCTSKIWSLRYDGSAVYDYQDRTSELDPSGSTSISSIVGFGEDAAGEMYICDLNGEVFRITAEAEYGACCVGDSGSCVFIPESNCGAGGGIWLGAGTSCADEGACDVNNCPADINGDGTVSTTDLLAIIADWGSCSGCPTDLNGDGTVSTTDLLAVIAAWGACP
ncbi:MAG TPA: sugar dehydrogenase [Phycisphaerales bacterium]|nr:sugar dehydrogenase [Phycisphaerales bacterium]